MKTTTQIKRTQLWKDIKDELHEDVSNFCVSDKDELVSWSETCLDCPSNTLMDLLKKIPQEDNENFYELINDEIEKIVESVSKEFEESDDE